MAEMIVTADSAVWSFGAGWLLLLAAGLVGVGHVVQAAIRPRR